MSTLVTAVDPFAAADDSPAVADLHAVFARQRTAFARDRAPGIAERRRRIETLMAMMLANRDAIGATAALCRARCRRSASADRE